MGFRLLRGVVWATCVCITGCGDDGHKGGGGGMGDGSVPNFGPKIYSQPTTAATEGRPYYYPVLAEDLNGDALTFTVTGPADMAIDAETGLVTWTPGPGTVGSAQVTVAVRDALGATDQQRYTIAVAKGQAAPHITSRPPLTGQRGGAYSYAAAARDDDDKTLTWSKVSGPAGLTVSPTGQVAWTVPQQTPGNNAVKIRVSDPGGLFDEQSFSIGVDQGGAGPTANITSPTAATEIHAPTTVTGTATADALAGYTLAACPPKGGCITLARGLEPVVNGVLGTFDPAAVPNGSYQLTVTAVDAANRSAKAQVPVSVAGWNKPGAMRLEFEDLSIQTEYGALELRRIYNGFDRRRGDFGNGWTLSWVAQAWKMATNQPLDLGWVNGNILMCDLYDQQEHDVTFTPADGQDIVFAVGMQCDGGAGMIHNAVPVVSEVTGSGANLQVLDNFGQVITWNNPLWVIPDGNGDLVVYQDDQFTPWKPWFRLTTGDGQTLTFNGQQTMDKFTDVDSGVEISGGDPPMVTIKGRPVLGIAKANGMITSLTDLIHGTTVTYTQDGNGDLTQVAAADGTQTYVYAEESRLLRYDVPGQKPTVFWYDDQGRVTRVQHPSGAIEENVYGDGFMEKIDAAGNRTRIDFDGEGRVVKTTDPMGATWQFEYGAGQEPTRRIDPYGKAWTISYDNQGRVRTATDPTGGTRSVDYDPMTGAANRVVDGEGHTFINNFDGEGRPTAVTADQQMVLSYAYPDSDSVTVTDAMNHSVTTRYDELGRPLAISDGTGNTSFAYDDANGTVTETGPRGSYTTSLDGKGRPTQLGGVQYTWGRGAGSLPTTVTDPSGAVTTIARGPDGTLAKVERDGKTQYEVRRDALGRVASERGADNIGVSYRYDAAGHVTQAATPFQTVEYQRNMRGDPEMVSVTNMMDGSTSTMSMEYDDAGRVIAAANSSGERVEMVRDKNGNIAEARNANTDSPHVLAKYDAFGRVIERELDGLREQYRYPAAFASDEETPLAGITTWEGVGFDYQRDAAGNIAHVTDSNGGENDFQYDAASHPTRRTDALGHSVDLTWSEDGMLTRRSAEGRSDTFTYANGLRVSWTRADGSTLGYQYGDQGQQIVDMTSGTVFEDGADPMTGEHVDRTTPGPTLRSDAFSDDDPSHIAIDGIAAAADLDYNEDGKVASITVTTPAGKAVTRYQYQGELVTDVVDPDGGTTHYGYDDLGRLARIDRPNGTSTAFTYGTLRRPTRIDHAVGANVTASYQYTFDGRGRVMQATRPDGTWTYQYDELNRLTRAERTAGGPPSSTSFGYDAVGNLTQVTDGAGTTTFTFDKDDRLVSANGPGGATTYSYNERGGLETVAAPDGTTRYQYDALDRPVMVQGPDGAAWTFRYSGSGRLLGGGGPDGDWFCLPAPENQLADPKGCLAVGPVADLKKTTVYVPGLLGWASSHRVGSAAAARYAWAADLGSVVSATDASGKVVGSRNYDAWGRVTDASGEAFAYGYTGGLQFGGDFVHLGARLYDARLRRFPVTDPVDFTIGDTRSTNPYAYAKDDPLNKFDPTGAQDLNSQLATTSINSGLQALQQFAIWCAKNKIKNVITHIVLQTVIHAVMEQIGFTDIVKKVVNAAVGAAFNLEDQWLLSLIKLFCGTNTKSLAAGYTHWSFIVPVGRCGQGRIKVPNSNAQNALSRFDCKQDLAKILKAGYGFFKGRPGIDVLYSFTDGTFSPGTILQLPFELKLGPSQPGGDSLGAAYNDRQAVKECRFASRKAQKVGTGKKAKSYSGINLIVYGFWNQPSLSKLDDAAITCFACWTDRIATKATVNLPLASQCKDEAPASKAGAIMIALSAKIPPGKTGWKAHVYIPSPKTICF